LSVSFQCQAPSLKAEGRAVHPIRWRKEFGGLKLDQVKRLKELENENARLRRAVSDLTLDKMILAEAAKGNY
jgi:cell division protein FtsB